MEPRFEFTFSYWIFVWFLIYYFGGTIYNPKIWLVISVLVNIFIEIYGRVFNLWSRPWIDNAIYIAIDLFVKGIPILLLWNTPNRLIDFLVGVGLYIIMIFWMIFRLGSIRTMIEYNRGVQHVFLDKKPATPFISYLHKWNIIHP